MLFKTDAKIVKMKHLFNKIIILLSILLLSFALSAQTIDNFSDGDLTNNPSWKGKLADFIVNDSYQLQLNASAAGESYLFLNQNIDGDTEWSFYIKQSFSPSGNNYSRVYLLANDSSLINSSESIYLQFGESGSKDAIELVKQNADEKTILIRGNSSISSSFEYFIRVRRSGSAYWSLEIKSPDENQYTEEGNAQESFFALSSFFGIYCKYTNSNKQRFFYDEIYIGSPRIDTLQPYFTSFSLISSDSIQLEFSEPLDTLSILDVRNYSINRGAVFPKKVNYDQNWKLINLVFEQPFEQNINIELRLRGLKDLANNTLKDTLISFTYYQLDTADLVINEVLFDPLIGGEEYLEIYNRSDKFLSWEKLYFLRIKKQFPNPPDSSLIKLTNENIVISPHEYWIISKSPEKVIQQYYTEHHDQIISCPKLPSLLNDEGILALVSDDGLLIDKIYYNHKMHHPLLSFTDGVALERINYDNSGYDDSNWHSAAQNMGFGTPTYKNSQFRELDKTEEFFTLSSKIISPDNDGFDDVLHINYSLTENGSIANVIIFNSSGLQIKYLINNEYLATEGSFVWNGTDDQNQISPMGIYIIYIELLDLNGKLNKFRKTVVLARQLN